MQPHLKQYWKIPPKASAAYVACMEDVLEVYARPSDPLRPVVCMDETNKQLIGEVREPLSVEAGERRTRRDWALWIAGMLETRYRQAERVVWVLDNLNTHGIESP